MADERSKECCKRPPRIQTHMHRFQVSRNVRDSHEILLDPAVTHESSNCHEFPLKPIISNEKLVVEGLTYCYFSCFYCFDTKLLATNQALATTSCD